MKQKTIRILALLMTFALAAASLAGCTSGGTGKAAVDPIDDNCRVIYQIFVGSFSDSDGDGTGDLRGIINRMDYLNDGDINGGNDLGVQLLWLSPVFQSPSYHKYDTIDYYTIDPKFGDEAAMKELLELCHARNVKVILDIALNHSSSSCVWFQKFVGAHNNGDTSNEYYDWYSWADADHRRNGCSYAKLGTTGTQFYECNFDTGMPELNYDNPKVREEMEKVCRYWLDLGVDGFRFDAVKYIYFGEAARNVAFWKDFLKGMKESYPDMYTVGECWSGNSEILQYYDALNCFDFSVATADGMIANAAKGKANQINVFTKYVTSVNAKITAMRGDAFFVPFIANHDMDRAAGYLTVSAGSAFMGANLLLLSPGSPVIYYGEEIAMKGSRGSSNTDANRRLAMLWGDGDTVRDPQGTSFDSSKQVNGTVQDQLADEASILNHYAKVISIRGRYPAIGRGTYAAIDFGDKFCGGFDITYGDERIAVIHNTGNAETTVDLNKYGAYGFSEILETVGPGEAKTGGGSDPHELTVGPYTSVILK
jgi:glycosidase